MKNIFLSSFVILSLLVLTTTALAAKPSSNYAGAQKYSWHLSGDVMPVPPYGSFDIPGSDTASKLIVNQPNGKVIANMTGVMNGLNPNTEYTVYLSKVYTPYNFTGWDVTGPWTISFDYLGNPYIHNLTLNQSSSTIGGSGSSAPYTWVIDAGTISGQTVTLTAHYTATADAVTPLTVMNMTGTIAPDGTMSGTWSDNYQGGSRNGTWTTTTGQAVKNYTGTAGWPGLLTPTVTPFTFRTNSVGSGTWHVNLTGQDITLPTDFSAWINSSGGTILISDVIPLGK